MRERRVLPTCCRSLISLSLTARAERARELRLPQSAKAAPTAGERFAAFFLSFFGAGLAAGAAFGVLTQWARRALWRSSARLLASSMFGVFTNSLSRGLGLELARGERASTAVGGASGWCSTPS